MKTLDLYRIVIIPFSTKRQILKVMFYHLLFLNAHLAYRKVFIETEDMEYEELLKWNEIDNHISELDRKLNPPPLKATDKRLKQLQDNQD